MRHRWLVGIAMALAGVAAASAQSWPSKPVRIVVPVTAGSATDVSARVIADHLAPLLGQPVVVENRTGAGGTTGMGYVAKSVEPDGYTVLVHSAAFVIQPATFPNLGYDSGKDFAGVTLIGNAPLVMIASPDKYKTLKELVTAAKARPNTVNYATVGYGAAAHLTSERLRLAAGFEAQQIPFRGAPEAVNEVLAKRVDFFFSPTLAAVPLIRDGKLSALAVSSSKRALVAAGGADHGRGGLSELRLQFLDRHVGAGEDAARRRRPALCRDPQGAGHAGRAGEAHRARQRAGPDDARGVRQVFPGGDQAERRSGEGGWDQAEPVAPLFESSWRKSPCCPY